MTVARARLANFRACTMRFRRLRDAGVNVPRLMRTGGVAALTYGQAVTGISNTLLLQQRRAVAAATVRTVGGGDLDLTLALADGSKHGRVDPAFEAHCQPIVFWAMAVWHEWLPRAMLSRLITAARARLARAKNPWAVVHGPAAAYVATASRLGWCVQEPLTVLTDDGVTLTSASIRLLSSRRRSMIQCVAGEARVSGRDSLAPIPTASVSVRASRTYTACLMHGATSETRIGAHVNGQVYGLLSPTDNGRRCASSALA